MCVWCRAAPAQFWRPAGSNHSGPTLERGCQCCGSHVLGLPVYPRSLDCYVSLFGSSDGREGRLRNAQVTRASRCLRRQPRRCPRILSVDDCARRQPGLDNGSQVVVDAGRRPTHGLCAERQISTGNCRFFAAHCISQCDTVMETRFAQLGFSWATLEVMGHERASEARRWGPHTAIWQRAPYRQY